MRFQQLTGPVMAKGLEDTAFYRYCPLLSLNEVGGSPETFGVAQAYFHSKNRARRTAWRNAMLASSTHDTKRSEDVRARINVLSEIPSEWHRAIRAWQQLNQDKKILVGGEAVPSANEEYFLYQTLVGAWPLDPMNSEEHREFVGRIHAYMEKALREAKVNTSWINPNAEYELAFHSFLDAILDRSVSKVFLDEFCNLPGQHCQSWNFQLAFADLDEDRLAWPAGFLPGHRGLELQPGRPGQSPPGELRSAEAHAGPAPSCGVGGVPRRWWIASWPSLTMAVSSFTSPAPPCDCAGSSVNYLPKAATCRCGSDGEESNACGGIRPLPRESHRAGDGWTFLRPA